MRIFKGALVLLVNFFFSPGFSQNWQHLAKGVIAGSKWLYVDEQWNHLYVYGDSFLATGDGDTVRGIARWNGHSFEKLGNGIPGNPSCYGLLRYKGTLYASGIWNLYGSHFAKYDDLSDIWDTIPSDVLKYTANLSRFEESMIVSGGFDTCAGLSTTGLCNFDGTNWTSLFYDPSAIPFDYFFSKMVRYKDDVYIIGNFYLKDAFGNYVEDIAIIKDGKLYPFGGSFNNGAMGGIYDIIVYKNELYLVGDFSHTTGDVGNYIMRWDGEALKEVGIGLDYWAQKFIVYNDILYTCGGFTYAGGQYSPRIAAWNGTEWMSINQDNIQGPLWDMAIYNKELFVAGYFFTIDGDTFNHVAKYNHTLPGNDDGPEVWLNTYQQEIIVTMEDSMAYTVTLDLYDVAGKRVKQYTLENQNGYLHQAIPVTELAAGVYIADVRAGNKRVVRKLLKAN